VIAEAILTVLLDYPVWSGDVGMTGEERSAMLEPVAAAIVGAAGSPFEAAVLTATAWHECGLASYVLDDRCEDGPDGARCDNGRARGPWQIHKAPCPALHELPLRSPERFDVGARCALRVWRGARYRCRGKHPAGDIAGAFSGYQGSPCTLENAVARERSAWAALARIRKAEQ
jgi:hypothetical protein